MSQSDWEAYKTAFNKTYTAATTNEVYARYYYAHNKRQIDSHNALYARGLRSFSLRVNQFTDMRLKHYQQLYPAAKQQPATTNASPLPPPSAQPAPNSFDPRQDLGLNVSVQNQGTRCNSGWAYATAKSVELLQAFQTGNLRPAELSAQNLIDCAGSSAACRNQVPQTAFDYLTMFNRDLHLASDYPNRPTAGEAGMCVPSGELVTNLRSYAQIPNGDDSLLQTYIAEAYSAVVEVNPNSFEFMHYAGGVFVAPHTKKTGSHYVTVMGYGTDSRSKLDYWLVLNSWGTTWGEGGFMRIARNPKTPITRSTLLPTELA